MAPLSLLSSVFTLMIVSCARVAAAAEPRLPPPNRPARPASPRPICDARAPTGVQRHLRAHPAQGGAHTAQAPRQRDDPRRDHHRRDRLPVRRSDGLRCRGRRGAAQGARRHP
eukprot:65217-Prymnesium_polylepis.1